MNLIFAVASQPLCRIPQIYVEGSGKPANESVVTVVIHLLPTARQFILYQY